jgi:predicted GIY-YIG superfamily endonuclease
MSKKMSLVSQHLENISREALEKYQDIVRRYVRNRQGVYALYRRNKLYYIGLASNLRSRLAHHLRDHHRDSWDRFSVYLTIGDSHLKELESLILRVVKPKGNKQKGKFLKSEDIRRKFARDVRSRQHSELLSLLGRDRVSEMEEGTLDIGK